MKRLKTFALAFNSFTAGVGVMSTASFINLGHARPAALAAALCMLSAGCAFHFARELAD